MAATPGVDSSAHALLLRHHMLPYYKAAVNSCTAANFEAGRAYQVARGLGEAVRAGHYIRPPVGSCLDHPAGSTAGTLKALDADNAPAQL
jgi:hypothetical protein